MKKAAKKKAVKTRKVSTKLVHISFTRTYEYAIYESQMPEPVQRDRLHVAIMGCGGPGKPTRVIDDGKVMCYIGIGWVIESDVAARRDYLRYPRVID